MSGHGVGESGCSIKTKPVGPSGHAQDKALKTRAATTFILSSFSGFRIFLTDSRALSQVSILGLVDENLK